jgi:hypothetical protein
MTAIRSRPAQYAVVTVLAMLLAVVISYVLNRVGF